MWAGLVVDLVCCRGSCCSSCGMRISCAPERGRTSWQPACTLVLPWSAALCTRQGVPVWLLRGASCPCLTAWMVQKGCDRRLLGRGGGSGLGAVCQLPDKASVSAAVHVV